MGEHGVLWWVSTEYLAEGTRINHQSLQQDISFLSLLSLFNQKLTLGATRQEPTGYLSCCVRGVCNSV